MAACVAKGGNKVQPNFSSMEGFLVAKVFAGGTDKELLSMLKRNFAVVKHAKPAASRKDSAEMYVVALGFKG